MLNDFLSFWLLPALVTLLLWLQTHRKDTGNGIDTMSFSDAAIVLSFSVFWPVGLIGWISVCGWPWLWKELIKER